MRFTRLFTLFAWVATANLHPRRLQEENLSRDHVEDISKGETRQSNKIDTYGKDDVIFVSVRHHLVSLEQ